MSDAYKVGSEQHSYNRWPGTLRKVNGGLLIAGALAASLAYCASESEKARAAITNACVGFGLCRVQKAPLPPVTIPDWTSGDLPGGHNPKEQCDQIQQAYQAKYPEYKVTATPLPEDPPRRDWKQHVTYRYHCSIAAVPTR